MTDKKHPLVGIPAGTRVRVTYEGVVSSLMNVVDDVGYHRFIEHGDTIEVIAPPDPEWWPPQAGDAVLTEGVVWQRLTNKHWWSAPGIEGLRVDENFRSGVATLIARNGKPYPPRDEK